MNSTPEMKVGAMMVPHTPEAEAPPAIATGPPGHPPPPPRHDAALVIYSDGGAAQRLIERLHKNPDVLEWNDDEILVSTIKRLTISSTKLVSVGSFIGNMNFLTHLNLSFNRIVEVSALAMCPNLVNIDISHNKIVTIESIRDLKDLKVLRCHHNHLETLEPVIELTGLQELWVSNNALQWTEFIYLLPLIKLARVVKLNNPADEKKLMNEFVHAICHDLRYIDGVDMRSLYQEESAREFLRSTDGKIMFSQALSQLPAHSKKLLQASEGDKARLRVEYTGAVDADGHVHPHHGMDPRYAQHEQHQSQQGKGQGQTQQGGKKPGGFRRGRRDLLGNKADSTAHDHNHNHNKGGDSDTASIRSNLVAEMVTHNDNHHNRTPHGSNSPTRGPTHASGEAAGSMRKGLNHKSHLREVKSSGYGQQPGRGGGDKVKVVKAKRNEYSTDYGPAKGELSDPVLSKEGPSSPVVAAYKDDRPKQPPLHLVRHGAGAPSDHVALCLYPDGSGYARYGHNNTVAVNIEKNSSNGSQKFLAYYRSGSLALTLDSAGNGSVMNPKGKCVCLLTSQGRGVCKIIHPKTGVIVAQYSRPPQERMGHGHHHNAVDYGGESGSAEAGSDNILAGSTSKLSLLTEDNNDKKNKEDKEDNDDSVGSPRPEARRKHAWKSDGLLLEFVPSSWDLRVVIENDRVSAEFSSQTGGKLVRAKGIDEAKVVQQLQEEEGGENGPYNDGEGGDLGSVGSHASHNSRNSQNSKNSQGSKGKQSSIAVDNGRKDSGRNPKRYLKSNMTEQNHHEIRNNVEAVLSNLDNLLGELNQRTPAAGKR